MPRGMTKLIPGKYVNVLIEDSNIKLMPPTVTVYGPYSTEDKAIEERRILLSEFPGLSGKILSHRARFYSIPMHTWGSPLAGVKLGSAETT